MNILIPDSWLRVFLKTKATPKQIKEYVSLCGPSIERIHTVGKDTIYDVEITTNRIDCMSVMGVARETATILPEFGINATYLPPVIPSVAKIQGTKPLGITISNDPALCYRILAIKLTNVKLGPSPKWLQERLLAVGQRPLNNIIDITNYVMWEIGHPIHAFDYDRLTEKKLIVREAGKGEHLTTLDGKKHTLGGGEIIFDDGTGTIIDFPGIMGTANTVINENTTNVMLFIENSDPVKIRQASMGLAVRTQAAVINEKGPDPALALPTLLRAVEIAKDIAGAKAESKLVDIFPEPVLPKQVNVEQREIDIYLGFPVDPNRVRRILTSLDCKVELKENKDEKKRVYSVTPPTFRANDIRIAQDVIEEIARIYGYHNITPLLPSREPPITIPDPNLVWEKEIKIRLRDWGYTELFTYSMISKELMDTYHFDTTCAYKISNPLSSEWLYMRPSLVPSVITALEQNSHLSTNLALFELSMVYKYRKKDLPNEIPSLVVAWTGERLREAKGLSQALFNLFGIVQQELPADDLPAYYNRDRAVSLGEYGSYGLLGDRTLLELDFARMVQHANPVKTYIPIPKYPPIIEDLSFVVIGNPPVKSMTDEFAKQSNIIHSITLLDAYKNSRTFRITYLHPDKTLTADAVKPVREQIIKTAEKVFSATLKGT